jgi:ABC-type lipoprotein export system ATPase subunit
MEPRILFADEPTGNLDSENGERVMHIFEKINKNLSTTIIMVTHEPDFAKRARRTIHLTDGVIGSDVLNSAPKRKK